MGRKGRAQKDPFADVHPVSGYVEKRIGQLRSDGPIGNGLRLGRSERDAILEFTRARRPEVADGFEHRGSRIS